MLKLSHSFRISIFRSTKKYCFSVFWEKVLERSRRLISAERGRRLITQVWLAYFDLFWLPVRLFYKHFRKNIHFALLKDRFEAFWPFFYEVTSVGELWTDKYLSYNFDSNLKLKKRNHWRGSFFEFWFYLFCAFQQLICPKRTPLTSAGLRNYLVSTTSTSVLQRSLYMSHLWKERHRKSSSKILENSFLIKGELEILI